MNRKKIAFIIPSLNVGGAERVVSTLSNELINTFDIVIIVLFNCTPFYTLDKRIEVRFCKEYSSNLNFFLSINNHFDLMKKCRIYIKDFNADVVIGFMATANVYSVLISKTLKAPCIISERTHPVYAITNRFWSLLKRRVYPKTNALVVQTQEIKNYFLPFIAEKKIIIINNPLAAKLVERKNIYASKENHIISVGRLVSSKNQELLIRAFANIDIKDYKLLLIGEGELRPHFENLIKDLNLEESVKLIGNIKDVSQYYNTSKIFVLPSNYEGFPNSLIEAMHFGLACIATDCPSGPSEILKDSENGFLVPVNDQIQLEKKLQLLVSNPDLQQKFSENAFKSTTIFNAKYIANIWGELINNVLK